MKISNKQRQTRPATVPYVMSEPKEIKPPSINMSIVYVTLFTMLMITLFMYGAWYIWKKYDRIGVIDIYLYVFL